MLGCVSKPASGIDASEAVLVRQGGMARQGGVLAATMPPITIC